ncbi:hypothetical protein B566_EDAN012911 [Ephemera danica]|nr:hypothetical protein B566_EDAN012911 [Ephemera danica]
MFSLAEWKRKAEERRAAAGRGRGMKVCAARWRACILAALLLAHVTQASPLVPRPSRRRVSRQAAVPLTQEEYLQLESLPQLLQQQQQLEEELVFGSQLTDQGPRDKRTIKLLLNVLFWKINTLLQFKTRILGEISERQRLGGRRPTSTTSAPNTARRTQRFIEALKPAIGRTLGYKISALTGGSSISQNTSEDSTSTTTQSNDI